MGSGLPPWTLDGGLHGMSLAPSPNRAARMVVLRGPWEPGAAAVVLRSAEEALTLPKGGLFVMLPRTYHPHRWARVDCSESELLDAARRIVGAGDSSPFRSRAAVVAHAGHVYGWGASARYRVGDVYDFVDVITSETL